MIITSRDNPKVKFVSKLCGSSRFRSENGLFVIEGLRLCLDAAQNGFAVDEFYFTAEFREQHKEAYFVLESNAEAVFEVSDDVMKKMSDTVSPQGCLCLCKLPGFKTIESFLPLGKYVILENVSDPSNLGAVARTVEAMGIDALFVSGGCDIYSPKALRASMGALLRLPVFKCEAVDMIKNMNLQGLNTYAAVVGEHDRTVLDCNFKNGCAVVIGNEASGLCAGTVSACTCSVTVPMNGKAESLNAAAAATILIWEMVR